MKKIVSSIFLAFMGGVGALGSAYVYNSYNQESGKEQLVQAAKNPGVQFTNYSVPAGAGNTDFTMAAARSVNSVVYITTKTDQLAYDPIAQMFGGTPQAYEQQASGSGVIISK